MDMSGMIGMGMGMDMSSDGMFKGTNMHIARIYWYIVAAVVALLGVRRTIEWCRTRSSVASHGRHPYSIPSRPENLLLQAYDTMIAICRELAYPQLWWASGPISRFFNPPALGRCLLLLVYWVLILTALWSNTILTPSSPNYAYKWEIVGFRAAWVSVTQLPLIYLLACKINVVSILTGISYERLNWLHRWVARTLFLTVIVHWSFFLREWWIADFVQLELDMMPMVKYGFGAWGVLGWMVLSGFGYFRQLSYEFFVLQHIASFTVLLWLVYTHVPAYAQYNVWMAVGFITLDRGGRSAFSILQNLHVRFNSNGKKHKYMLGYSGRAEATVDDHVLLTIQDINISWSAGQHIFISIPRCGIFQSHPFTLAGLQDQSNTAKLIVKAHSGFSRKLLNVARERPHQDLRIFISRPYGSPPLDVIERSDSLILMATSTGASFIIPIMQHAVNNSTSIRRICLYWIVRNPAHLDWFSSDIVLAVQKAQSHGIQVSVQTYITKKYHLVGTSISSSDASSSISTTDRLQDEKRYTTQGTALLRDQKDKEIPKDVKTLSLTSSQSSCSSPSSSSRLPQTFGRPTSFDALIRPTIEDSDGETAIIACGGAAFMAELRNYAAALSDERAVHKGTGAQGIFLFTETYGW